MDNDLIITKNFARRMLLTAVLLAIFIAVTTPSIYALVSWKYEKNKLNNYAESLGWKMQDVISNDLEFWRYDYEKFTQVFYDTLSDKDIVEIKVYDKNFKLINTSKMGKVHLATFRKMVKINFNNQTYGYIIVTKNATYLIHTTAILLTVFTFSGILIGSAIYKYPVRYVLAEENKVNKILKKLTQTNMELESVKDNLEQKVIRDGKTELYNATYIYTKLEEEIARIKEFGGCVSLIILDIDHFKKYNDYHGHVKGDNVLISLSRTLEKNVRINDIVGRYGGEEFIIILPNTINPSALSSANRIRKAIEKKPFDGEEKSQPGGILTASIGVTTYSGGEITAQKIIDNADKALYIAKQEGRNRVFVWEDS